MRQGSEKQDGRMARAKEKENVSAKYGMGKPRSRASYMDSVVGAPAPARQLKSGSRRGRTDSGAYMQNVESTV